MGEDEIEKRINLLEEKKAKLSEKQNQLDEKKRAIKQMQQMESYRLKLIRQSYQLAEPGKSLIKGSSLERKWAELHAQINLVEEFISNERNRLGLPSKLNKALIDTILEERSNKEI